MRTLDVAWNLYIKYGQLEEIKHYYGLLALYGLGQTAYEDGSREWADIFRTALGRYPDGIRHPNYNFACYKAGGNAQSWAAMTGLAERGEAFLDEYAALTRDGCKGADGILCMPGMQQQRAIWIDTVAAVTPFMLFAGLTLGREEYIDFAAEQCFGMYEALLDRECGLLHQCRGFLEDAGRCSEDHWSRGNGWGYMGLAEMVKYLPENSPHRPKAEKYFLQLSENILRYQTKKGLWRQEMTEPLSWEESSGTAMFLYGLGGGIRLGLLQGEEYASAFRKGLEGLLKYCMDPDFSTERSCPGCLCPGEGEDRGTIAAYLTEKQPEKNEHHSFGAFMLALVEAHRNGIKEIVWSRREIG